MRKPFWWAGGGIVILAALVAAWVTLSLKQKTPVYHKPVANAINDPVDPGTSLNGTPAPNFTLTDQYGKTFSLSQFRGKVVVLAFVDSQCTNICPLTTESMMHALQLLGPEAAAHVQLVGVNANPTATAQKYVKAYSVAHGMMNSWHFGTASLAQLKAIWSKYNIESQIVNGAIDHTPALYIIDPQGKEQELFLTASQYAAVSPESNVLAGQIAKFLPSGVQANPLKSATYVPSTLGPSTAVEIPKVTPSGEQGTVTLGPGKPQLDVFFGSWLPNSKQDLAALSAYALAPGSPQVVGVDVATTEPSDTTVQKMLQRMPKLSYPIGIDKTGELSDGYNVTDLMWLTLTDGKGHVIWHHDGWLPVQTLKSDVTKALQVHHVQP